MTLLFFLSILFLFMTHPLSMGMILLIQTIIISFNISLQNFNSWYSYILMLIMIGGMLIMFIYMTSVASNEKFEFSYWLFTPLIIFILPYEFKNINLFNMNEIYFYENSMSKYFSYPMNMILILIIFYLLLAMIAIVKICKSNKGSLQQKF